MNLMDVHPRRASITRRQALMTMGASISAIACSGSRDGKESGAAMNDDAARFDEALESLEGLGPVYGGGLANHAPMAIEALWTMGRAGDLEKSFLGSYRKLLERAPSGKQAIDPDDCHSALGDEDRATDWRDLFARELEGRDFREMLTKWLPLLAPGLVGAAAHGAIRTAHAVRALERGVTAPRTRELAEGLGYFASSYARLPGSFGRNGSRLPSQAIGEVEVVPASARRTQGFILDRLSPLADVASFAQVMDLVDATVSADVFLDDLARTAADLYLKHGARHHIVFVHELTATAAVQILLPYVPQANRSNVLRLAWQAVAGMYAAHAGQDAGKTKLELPRDIDDLVDRAVATRDEHAFKFTEACLRFHKTSSDERFLAAAQAAIARS